MNSFSKTLYFFTKITAELTILFLGISTLVALLLMYMPEDRVKNWIAGKGILGNVIGALIGAVTPFCVCSTIPLTLGFLEAGIKFGAIMSFVISSPLLNPIILAMLVVLMGWKASITYFIIVFGGAIIFGVILEKAGCEQLVKKAQIKEECCASSKEELPKEFKIKLKLALHKAWSDFRGVLIYMLVGIGIGAMIYGYLPEDIVLRFAGPDNPFAIPVAAVIGIPLYIRAESAIPIGVALLQKGMNIGAVIALIIGGAGMAIPEMSMLASIFKKKLVCAIIVVIFLTAVMGGYVFNLISSQIIVAVSGIIYF